MALAQIAGNARHQRIIEFAPANRDRQQQMKQRRQQALHGRHPLERRGRLVSGTGLIGHYNKYQADNAGAGRPGELDEKEVKREIHSRRTHAGFPLAVIVGKRHQGKVQRQREAENNAVAEDNGKSKVLMRRACGQ